MHPNDITREEFESLIRDCTKSAGNFGKFWSRIREVQSGEPMSEEEIFDFLRKEITYTAGVVRALAKVTQPLTRRQGFIHWKDQLSDKLHWPDVNSTDIVIAGYDVAGQQVKVFGNIPRPKQKRRKTDEELLSDVFSNTGSEIGWKVIALRLAAKETPEQIALSYGVELYE